MATGIFLGISGTYLNLLKEPFCFVLWLASNSIFMAAAWKDRNSWMYLVFLTYFAMSFWGLITW